MKKIRYKEINRKKFEIILPDIKKSPIGLVFYDMKKRAWLIRPYFATLFKDNSQINKEYSEFTLAGRALADIWEYTSFLTSKEDTDEYNMDDIFSKYIP